MFDISSNLFIQYKEEEKHSDSEVYGRLVYDPYR
jgi:hypothetical protein